MFDEINQCSFFSLAIIVCLVSAPYSLDYVGLRASLFCVQSIFATLLHSIANTYSNFEFQNPEQWSIGWLGVSVELYIWPVRLQNCWIRMPGSTLLIATVALACSFSPTEEPIYC
jgi:hypothetical protein